MVKETVLNNFRSFHSTWGWLSKPRMIELIPKSNTRFTGLCVFPACSFDPGPVLQHCYITTFAIRSEQCRDWAKSLELPWTSIGCDHEDCSMHWNMPWLWVLAFWNLAHQSICSEPKFWNLMWLAPGRSNSCPARLIAKPFAFIQSIWHLSGWSLDCLKARPVESQKYLWLAWKLRNVQPWNQHLSQ